MPVNVSALPLAGREEALKGTVVSFSRSWTHLSSLTSWGSPGEHVDVMVSVRYELSIITNLILCIRNSTVKELR